MDREKVIKEWEAVLSRDPLDAPWDLIDETLALLKEQEVKEQISDAIHETAKQFRQTIVRCKDCERRGTYDCPVYVGGDGMYSEPDDWFCGDGERKDT